MMKIESISSLTNSKFKIWKSLLTSKGIREEGLCLISGSKVVEEILHNKKIRISCALLPNEDQIDNFRHLSQIFTLSAPLFKELDSLGTHHPILVVEIPQLDIYQELPPQGLEVVIPLSDPANVGALIRSCVAFNVNKIILTKEAANAFLPKSLRASSGSALVAPLVLAPRLEDFAQNTMQSNSFFALDMKGQDIRTFKWPPNLRLIVGEEGQGLPKSFEYVTRLSISTSPLVESLNAVVATSLALYAFRSNHK